MVLSTKIVQKVKIISGHYNYICKKKPKSKDLGYSIERFVVFYIIAIPLCIAVWDWRVMPVNDDVSPIVKVALVANPF